MLPFHFKYFKVWEETSIISILQMQSCYTSMSFLFDTNLYDWCISKIEMMIDVPLHLSVPSIVSNSVIPQWTTMTQTRLNHLMIVHYHQDMTDSHYLKAIGNEFIMKSEVQRITFVTFPL